MHNSMGSFGPNTLTLIDRVCGMCNQYFADDIDLSLGRDGHDALHRFRHGVKDIKKLHEFRAKKINFNSESTADPNWDGIITDIVSVNGQIAGQLARQVAFKHIDNGKWIHFREHEFDKMVEIPVELSLQEYKIHGPTDEDMERIRKKLESRGITANVIKVIEPDVAPSVIAQSDFDSSICRAIAKIAFNYLCKMTKDTNPELIYDSAFDTIRKFIRYALVTGNKLLVRSDESPILANDTCTKRQTNGHLVTVESCQINGSLCVMGRVALFDDLIWNVLLSDNCPSFFSETKYGHHWNHEKHTCESLSLTP